MYSEVWSSIVKWWEWSRANDLPNWAATAFSLVVWPLVLILWQRRRVASVSGLEVHFFPGTISIGPRQLPAVDVRFTNHTGSVTYISGVRVKACTPDFPVPIDAARDVSSNSYQLKFFDGVSEFKLREITLQTNASAQTCMPAAKSPDDTFLKFKPSGFRRLFRRHRYFVLEYTALVGHTRYLVSTRY